MSKRNARRNDEPRGDDQHSRRDGERENKLSPPDAPPSPSRVLIVDGDAAARKAIQAALGSLSLRIDCVSTLDECQACLGRDSYDVVIMDMQVANGAGLALVRSLATNHAPTRTILLAAQPTLDNAVEAMRCGAVDMVTKPIDGADLARRTSRAVDTARELRARDRRVERLKRICKRLNQTRDDDNKKVDVLCHDLIGAYQELADQMGNVTVSSEFGSMVRQELDVEVLLRKTLEYLLGKTGPTNAAVFLPTGHCDFNLGAYVNYDIPKEHADVLLDQLSDIVAPRFMDDTQVHWFKSKRDLSKAFGEEANWLAEYGVIVFSCRHDDESLAVFAIFRDRSSPFTEEMLRQLAVMRDLFADQLARVVRIHHRHIHHDHWPGFDVETDDDIGGMAA